VTRRTLHGASAHKCEATHALSTQSLFRPWDRRWARWRYLIEYVTGSQGSRAHQPKLHSLPRALPPNWATCIIESGKPDK
jgi:hypothetical protein